MHDQCQSDLQDFCEFPLTRPDDIGASDLDLVDSDKHTVPVQDTHTVITVTPTKLRAASLFGRSLSEETSTSKPLFPLECLKTAWIEQRVTPACSFALDQLQSVSELQHQQELNRLPALCLFRTTWTFFLFTGLFSVLPDLWNWIVWCAVRVRDIAVANTSLPYFIWIWVFLFHCATAPLVFYIVLWFFYLYGEQKEGDWNKDGSCPDRKQECSSWTQEAAKCDSCSKTEIGCECCEDTCLGDDGCCRGERTVVDASTEEEVLIVKATEC